VSDEHRRAVAKCEAGESGHGFLASGRSGKMLVGDAGEALDRRRQRPPWIGEREKPLAEIDPASRPKPDADGADLDDPFALGLVPGRLEIDRNELVFQRLGRSSRRAGGRSSRRMRAPEMYCGAPMMAVAPTMQASDG